jgi:hypothetical protein
LFPLTQPNLPLVDYVHSGRFRAPGQTAPKLQASILFPAVSFIVSTHLVLGPASSGKPIRFRVRIDGQAPGVNHGIDTDAQGNGKVIEHRLYQLIRVKNDIQDRTFEIEFLDPGVEAFAFTFG